jgi:hypothetical protein
MHIVDIAAHYAGWRQNCLLFVRFNYREIEMKTWMPLALMYLCASTANASLIRVIDPEAYGPGTNISEQFEGVSLSALVFGSGAMLEQSIFSSPCNGSALCSELGAAVFGYQTPSGSSHVFMSEGSSAIHCLQGQPSPWCWTHEQQFLEITFDDPTGFVELNSAHYSDWPMVWAFDQQGNLLELVEERTFTAPWPDNNFETLSLTSTGANIHRLVAAGSMGFVTFDRISYSVPEPETLGLMVLGIVGIWLSRSSRKLASN